MSRSYRSSPARPSIEIFGNSHNTNNNNINHNSYSYQSSYSPGVPSGHGLGLEPELARMEDEGETVSSIWSAVLA